MNILNHPREIPLPLIETESPRSDAAALKYQETRRQHWDEVARLSDHSRDWGTYYHSRLIDVYRFSVPPGQRVLELGCGLGDLLAALDPATGVGVDFSPENINRARARHPELTFIEADAHDLDLDATFDFIILSDLINDLWDVQAVLQNVRRFCHPQTRLVINTYSRIWELPLGISERLRLSRPTLYQNWFTVEDTVNLMRLAGFETVRSWTEVLFPLKVPIVTPLCNRFLIRFWPFKYLALTNMIVGRPEALPFEREPLVSVIVPARNEAGNIDSILERIPEMGAGTELVFVEGHSADNTYQKIQDAIAKHPERRITLFKQNGKGKGDAVRLGFSRAGGEILMILDADLSVPPESLTRFYEAILSGKADFLNGVRLVYPMEARAMRFLNMVANRFFSVAFSWLLGQPIKDTLCGTKVMRKADYEKIASNRGYFGEFDPFGDFDLIFGASKLNLKILDMPVRYRERTYGTTNIQRWRHGLLLLRMVIFASLRIKFV